MTGLLILPTAAFPMEKDFLQQLNEAQRQAVINTEGPSLVIAGAGSGKTRVLTMRIAHLLQQGVPAKNILALTFTNKAAAEMKERIASLVGHDECKSLWMGTFHSIFARILRSEAQRLGYSPRFTIYDTADVRSLIKGIIKEMQLDDKTYPPNEITSRISSAKNNLVTAMAYYENADINRQDASLGKPRIAEIYRSYAARCKKADAMDFDDLLLNTNILFRDFPEALTRYQNHFRYILVDEYQDTNYSQYLIVHKLAQPHKNVCVVGDDAQSIYSFRGARIENILNFRNDYPGYKLFKLEQNYRSTQTIVNAANSIIARNKGQIQKNVFSTRDTGEKIKILKATTDQEEGFQVAAEIHQIHYTNQAAWMNFAILYRTNAQSRIFEEALRKKNIPYKIYGGLSFYQRKEIKDLLSYFRLIINPNDEEAFLRIINYPARGIGDTTLEKLQTYSSHHNITLWNLIISEKLETLDINKGTQNKLRHFASLIHSFQQMLSTTDSWELAMFVAEQTGMLRDLNQDKTPEGISRSENIQELLNSIREFSDHTGDKEHASLTGFMENVSLLTDMDNEKEEDRDKLTMMTVHSAKGLEFDYVFIVGMEDELFPSLMSAQNPRDLEEERRLFYVALTRAKKRAVLSWSETRYRWGQLTGCRPSRFLGEIDQEFIEENIRGLDKDPMQAAFRRKQSLFDTTVHKNSPTPPPASPKPPPPARLVRMPQAKQNQPASPITEYNPHDFKPGTKVEHERFGAGVIAALEGEYPNMKATVDFNSSGRKQLLLKFARLRRLS